eukprot:2831553-Pleurochrysis_carterae.AAC.3
MRFEFNLASTYDTCSATLKYSKSRFIVSHKNTSITEGRACAATTIPTYRSAAERSLSPPAKSAGAARQQPCACVAWYRVGRVRARSVLIRLVGAGRPAAQSLRCVDCRYTRDSSGARARAAALRLLQHLLNCKG